MSTMEKNPLNMFGYLAKGYNLRPHFEVARKIGISPEALFEMCEKNIGMTPMPVLVQNYYWFLNAGCVDTWKLWVKKAPDAEIEAAAEIILRHDQAKRIPDLPTLSNETPRDFLARLFTSKRK